MTASDNIRQAIFPNLSLTNALKVIPLGRCIGSEKSQVYFQSEVFLVAVVHHFHR